LNTPARVSTNELAAPTKKTAQTFKQNVNAPLARKIEGPMRWKFLMGSRPSLNGSRRRLKPAHTGAK
jgi:hypothetical protein